MISSSRSSSSRSTTNGWAIGALYRAILGLAILIGSGCEDAQGPGGDGGIGDGAVGDTRVQDAAQLPEGLLSFHAAGEKVDVSFDEGDEEFVVAAYSVDEQVASEIPFTVNVEGTASGLGTTEQSLRRPNPGPASVGRAALARRRGQIAMEAWQRALMRQASRKRLVSPRMRLIAEEQCTLSADCPEAQVCHAHVCSGAVTIRTGRFSDTATIETRVMAKGNHVAVLADSAIADSLTTESLAELVRTIDEKIYPRDVALFGNPPLRNDGSELSSDRNGDGLFWLVLTERVADQHTVLGFFVPTDFVLREGEDGDPHSNEADILYALPPGSGADALVGVYRIVAHELQHLLGFAVKVRRPQANGEEGTLEALWLDEGQSYLAEDLCGYSEDNVDLLYATLPDLSSTSMTADESDSLGEQGTRALAYLFVRYLFEQKGGVTYSADGSIQDRGGAAWTASLRASKAQGRALIEETYGPFVQAFDRWVATLALDNRNVTESALLNYREPIRDPLPPHSDIGMRLRGTFVGTESPTVELQGPSEAELEIGETEGAVASTAIKFYLLKGLEGSASITVSAGQGTAVRFAVIKVK